VATLLAACMYPSCYILYTSCHPVGTAGSMRTLTDVYDAVPRQRTSYKPNRPRIYSTSSTVAEGDLIFCHSQRLRDYDIDGNCGGGDGTKQLHLTLAPRGKQRNMTWRDCCATVNISKTIKHGWDFLFLCMCWRWH